MARVRIALESYQKRRSRKRLSKSFWESLDADAIVCMFYEHFERWPEDIDELQTLIRDAFLYHFKGPEGDSFRSLVHPTPLSRWSSEE